MLDIQASVGGRQTWLRKQDNTYLLKENMLAIQASEGEDQPG